MKVWERGVRDSGGMSLEFHEDLEIDLDAKALARRLGTNARERARQRIIDAGHVDTGRLTGRGLGLRVSGRRKGSAIATIRPPKDRVIWLSAELAKGRRWISVNRDVVHEDMQAWLREDAFK